MGAVRTGGAPPDWLDSQDSTKLWESMPHDMARALEVHNEVMRAAVLEYRGYEVSTSGDSFFVVFQNPRDALEMCFHVQVPVCRPL